jgi:DNA polymerase-3 subunit delta'
VELTPVEGPKKVYIVGRADTLNAEAANALLKTLEEPPDDVVIVLLSTSAGAVLPTISSRCQVVRFQRIGREQALASIIERTGTDEDGALAALAAAGGVVPRAIEIVRSPSRSAARDAILLTLKNVAVMDGLDILDSVKSLMVAVRAPLDDLREAQEEELAQRKELLGPSGGSTKPIENKHKRELTAREREGLVEVLNVTESWLRDCLAMSRGVPEVMGNRDQSDAMIEIADVMTADAAVKALKAVGEARRRISYNVSPQLALEAMLLDIREVLRCPR